MHLRAGHSTRRLLTCPSSCSHCLTDLRSRGDSRVLFGDLLPPFVTHCPPFPSRRHFATASDQSALSPQSDQSAASCATWWRSLSPPFSFFITLRLYIIHHPTSLLNLTNSHNYQISECPPACWITSPLCGLVMGTSPSVMQSFLPTCTFRGSDSLQTWVSNSVSLGSESPRGSRCAPSKADTYVRPKSIQTSSTSPTEF